MKMTSKGYKRHQESGRYKKPKGGKKGGGKGCAKTHAR